MGHIKFPHTCPKCKDVTALNSWELFEKFGLRNIKKDAIILYVTNQSYCRKCRNMKPTEEVVVTADS